MDNILLEGHTATYKFSNFHSRKKNQFKLQLKESLLIKKDKLELNRNICTYSIESFA